MPLLPTPERVVRARYNGTPGWNVWLPATNGRIRIIWKPAA